MIEINDFIVVIELDSRFPEILNQSGIVLGTAGRQVKVLINGCYYWIDRNKVIKKEK